MVVKGQRETVDVRVTYGPMEEETPRTGASSGHWWPRCPCPHISAILSPLSSALPPSLVLAGGLTPSVSCSLFLYYCHYIASCLWLISCHKSIHLCHSSETLPHSLAPGPRARRRVSVRASSSASVSGRLLCPDRPTPVFLTVPLPFSPQIPFVQLHMFLSSNLWVSSLGSCMALTSLPLSSLYKPCTVAGPSLQPESECSLLSCWLSPKPSDNALRLTLCLVARPWACSTWLP